jgi:hypothetical protein
MATQNNPAGEEINPMSRKTNEEIETDDKGNLRIHGKRDTQDKSEPSDGPVSQDLPKGRNSMGVED